MPRPPAAGVEGPLVPSTLACFLCDLQSGFGQSQYQASSHCWFAQCLSEKRGHRTWWLHSGAKESTWVWEVSFAKWVCLVIYIYIYTYIYMYTIIYIQHIPPYVSNILQHSPTYPPDAMLCDTARSWLHSRVYSIPNPSSK